MICSGGHGIMSRKLYTPSQIGKMSTSDINKAYSELRSIANKRIGRLEAQELGRVNIKFPTIKSINESSKWSIESKLADVSKFLSSDRTTVRGEKKFLNTFKEQMTEKGYGSLVQDNDSIYKMIDFMDSLREQYSSKIFDSGDALDVLEETERLNIPIEKVQKNFDMFVEHLDELSKVKPSKDGREFSQRRLNTLIKKWN